MSWRLVKYAAVSIVLATVAGVVYEQIGERRDRTRYAQIGRSVDIGGRSLNLYCSGAGTPTVILESGGHTAGYSWVDIQRQAAMFTRACWYDRAGYGWSDPGPPPRTFRAIAEDLHALLQAAEERGPFVLAGATAGAFHVRVYNGLFPDEVAGAVLIHATDADVFEHEPSYMKGVVAALPRAMQKIGCDVVRPVMSHIGLLRLMGNPGAGRPFGIRHLGADQRRELLFLSSNASTVETDGEGCTLAESMSELRAAGGFGDRPLYVLAGATRFQAPGPEYEKQTEALNEYWFHQLQPRLAALSSKGHLIVDEKAEEPDSIVRAVRDAVEAARARLARSVAR